MGLSLTIIAVGDDELARFQAQPRALEALLTGPNLPDDRPACYLNGYWPDLHDLLAHSAWPADGPRAALVRGDVDFPHASDTVHAIISATASRLATLLSAVVRDDVRQFVAQRLSLAELAKLAPSNLSQWVPNPAAIETQIGTTWLYLTKYRDVTRRAVEQGRGLLFWRWEDW